MEVRSNGYYFDTTYYREKIGVKENYSMFNRFADLTIGVAQNGDIPSAVVYYKNTGFSYLSSILKSEEDFKRFMKAHRATYGVFGSITLVCVCKVNIDTGEFKRFELYTPIGTVDNSTGIICDLVTREGVSSFHSIELKSGLYDGLEERIKDNIRGLELETREDYLRSRL